MDQNYIGYKHKLLSSLSGWKDHSFYIGNHKPALLERTNEGPKIVPEWKERPVKGDMDQVHNLIKVIKALKEMNVTGASIMYSWIARRIQSLKKRDRFGFEYLDTEDPYRLVADRLMQGEALRRVKRVLLDVHTMPYVPKLFNASNAPNQVKVKLPVLSDQVLFLALFVVLMLMSICAPCILM